VVVLGLAGGRFRHHPDPEEYSIRVAQKPYARITHRSSSRRTSSDSSGTAVLKMCPMIIKPYNAKMIH